MKDKVYGEFYKCYKILKKLSHHFIFSYNSNDKVIASLVNEQLILTRSILTLLGQESVARKRTCHAIAMLYRSNEDFNRSFMMWNDHLESRTIMTNQVLNIRKTLAMQARGHLIAAIPIMDHYFGKLTTRQIIPNTFRHQLINHL